MKHVLADIQLEPLAENAWLLRFGETIDAAVNARVHAAARRLQEQLPEVECVPAYASLLLRFDEAASRSMDAWRNVITEALIDAPADADITRELTLPVWYGGEAGIDLVDVAAHAQLTPDEVVRRHTAATYRVAMLGFAPGFPYLLGLDSVLAMPRRSSPRTHVPAGSVAIGGLQTGIYPQALPGGWQLIGRTPVRLFDLSASSPSLLQPGDQVRFRAIDEHEYHRLTAEAGASA